MGKQPYDLFGDADFHNPFGGSGSPSEDRTDEIQQDLTEVYQNLAMQMMWECFWFVCGASPAAMQEILKQVVDLGYEGIMKTVDQGLEGQGEDVIDAAKGQMHNHAMAAAKTFLDAFSSNITTDEFKLRVIKAVRDHVKATE